VEERGSNTRLRLVTKSLTNSLVASLGLGTANIPFTGNRLALAHRRLNVFSHNSFLAIYE